MNKILFVEDSTYFATTIIDKFKIETNYEIIWTKSLEETKKVLDNNEHVFNAAIIDFKLPDSQEGEVIDVVVTRNIPAIVLTGHVNTEIRNIVWSKYVVDYVLKEDPQSINHIITLIKNLETNNKIKIIVVDDSIIFRKILVNLLKIHKYEILEANNAEEALELIENNPETKLIITEYNLPNMNGLTLAFNIRKKYTKEHMAIIGISTENKTTFASRFLKNGANDYLEKQNFITEEFYARVSQNIEYIQDVETIRDASIKDYLTGLFNRRYFFEIGQKFLANANRGNITLTCAMLDIDDFKKVNDKFGHNAGDLILQNLAILLQKRFRQSDIVARIGGEEFCILAVNMEINYIKKVFEDLRRKIEEMVVIFEGNKELKITATIGVYNGIKANLDEITKEADMLLYQGKKSGKNKVVLNF